jgi:hypothetical protein
VKARTYRLTAPDSTGWYLGLGGPQVTAFVVSVAVGLVAVMAGRPAVMPVALACGGALALGRWRSEPLLDTLGSVARLTGARARRGTWQAPLHLLGGSQDRTGPLPQCLDGQVLVVCDPADYQRLLAPTGAVVDRRAGTVAVTLRVRGRDFVLAEPVERDQLVAGWGAALSGFSGSPAVDSVRWCEWAAPTGIEEQLAFLGEHGNSDVADPAVATYQGLLADAGPLATRHEVLVTVVVRADRVAAPRGVGRTSAAIAEALTEARLLGERLRAAGLLVTGPLTAGELARAIRVRLDPACQERLDARGRSLGDLAGLVAPANTGPLSAEVNLRWWRADDSLHRAFLVTGWPRRPLAADWLGGLILEGACVRSLAVHFQPRPPAESLAKAEHRAAQLDGDAHHRAEKGFRLGARFEAARQAVAEREAELVAGHSECRYVGLLDVTAATPDALDDASRQMTQLAARWGVELRPLHGRHDQAVVACLPVARGVQRSRR